MKRSRYRYGRQTGIVLDQRAVDCRTVVHAVETLHRPLQHLLRVSSVENQPPHPHDSHQLRHHVAVHSPTDATRLHRTPSWSVRPSLLVILITTITNRHFKHSGRSLSQRRAATLKPKPSAKFFFSMSIKSERERKRRSKGGTMQAQRSKNHGNR